MSRCLACNQIMTTEEMKFIEYIDDFGKITYTDLCDHCRWESTSEYNILDREYLFDSLTSSIDFK